nr:hypothetical protein [Tanacetum cinerariifolium]
LSILFRFNDSIPLPENESFYFDHLDNPSFSRPPPKPLDVEFYFDLELNLGEVISAMINNIDELNEDECFDPGGEINVLANDKDDDYFPFMFVIRIFLPYLIYPEVSSLLLFEFSGKLAHLNPILPEIKEADFDLEEEIRFVENLLYDNSSPRPPKELNAKIADTIVKSLSPSPISVEDSDSLMDEIDLFLATDELLPPNIKSDDYDSEGDIHFLEKLLVNDSIPLPENELGNIGDNVWF